MKTGRIKMKSGVVPHIFDCQKNRATLHSSKPRELFRKREQRAVIESSICGISKNELALSEQEPEQEATTSTKTIDRGIQVTLKPLMRSKAIQCTNKLFICTPQLAKKRKQPETANESPQKKKRLTAKDFSPDQEQSFSTDFSTSTEGSTVRTSESSLSGIFAEKWNAKENVEKRAIYVIEKNPKRYLGLPNHSMFIIEMLS